MTQTPRNDQAQIIGRLRYNSTPGNPVQALELALGHRRHAILMDLMMLTAPASSSARAFTILATRRESLFFVVTENLLPSTKTIWQIWEQRKFPRSASIFRN